MKKLYLKRSTSKTTHVEGHLIFNNTVLCTLERPWIEVSSPGGKPFESCVPVGKYKVIKHVRPSGDTVPALINKELGVYYLSEDRPNGKGRYLILIHVGNWVDDIVGCIAPGLTHTDSKKGRMVTRSRDAMKKLMEYLDGEEEAELNISWAL